MSKPLLESETAYVKSLVDPVIKRLKENPALRRDFANYCVGLGGDAMSMGDRIKQLVRGRKPTHSFVTIMLVQFGATRGIISLPWAAPAPKRGQGS